MVGERWSEVVRRGKGRSKRNNSSTGKKDDESTVMPRWVGVSIANTTKKKRESHKPKGNHTASRLNRKPAGEKIPGMRKVWGSMRSCSVQSMASTIAKLCPTMVEKLQVRRKYKTSRDGKISRWWFLIRGEEQVLTELEEKWGCVALQTSWKLEDCLKYNKPEQQPPPSPGSSLSPQLRANEPSTTPPISPASSFLEARQ